MGSLFEIAADHAASVGPRAGGSSAPAAAGGRRPSSTGLVSTAYVPSDRGITGVDQTLVEVCHGGALIRFREEKRGGRPPIEVKRGKCRGMSRDARRRQLQFVQSIDRRQVKGVVFVSMTLRGCESVGVVESWGVIEAARRKWFKRLEHFLKDQRWFAIWRKEPHESGVAHLHVLLFFLDKLPNVFGEFVPWNDDAWAACVGDPSIRRTACSTEFMKGWSGVVYYLTKYLAKFQDMQEVETGKVWDVVHRAVVPVDRRSETVKREEQILSKRACRKWQQRQSESWQVRVQHDDGHWFWRTIRPWSTRSGRRVEISEQVQKHKLAGLRVRRRRPKLSCTRVVPIWMEEDGRPRPADLGREPWLADRGAFILEDLTSEFHGQVVERHTYFAGTYFLPASDATKLISWARRRHVERLLEEESVPF